MTLFGLLFSVPAHAAKIAKIKSVTDLNKHDVRDYPTPLAQLLQGPLPSAQGQNVDRDMDIQEGDSLLTGRANTHVSMNRGDRQAFFFSDTLVSFDALNIWAIERGAMYVVNPRGRLEILKRKLATVLANSEFYMEVADDRILLYVFEGLVTLQTSLGSLQLTAAQAGRVSAGGKVQQTTLSASEESRIRSEVRGARNLMSAGGPGAGALAVGATVVAAGAAAYVFREDLQGGTPYPRHVAPQADMAVTSTSSLIGSAVINGRFSLLIQVTNNGPEAASDVTLTDPIPDPLSIEAVTSAGASCTPSGAIVGCTLANLPAGGSFGVTIRVVATRAVSSVVNTASVRAAQRDPDQGNNSSSVSITIEPPRADLAVTQTVSLSGPALVSVPFSFLIQVSNNGPQAASNVTLNDTIPGPLLIQGVASSAGACSPFGTTVRCTLSTLPAGGSFGVSIAVVALRPISSVTSGCTVSATETDPDQGNNFSSVSLSVESPPKEADIAVTQTVQAVASKIPLWRITAKVQNRGPTLFVADIDLDFAINATQSSRLVPESITFSSLMRDCDVARAQPGSIFGCNTALEPFQEALVTFDIESCCAFTSTARTLACEGFDPDCSNNTNLLQVVGVSTTHDPVHSQTQESQPRTVALGSSLSSVLFAASPERAHGTIVMNGQYVGTVERSSPRSFPILGKPGENHVEAWLAASPLQPMVWQFSFEGASAFVPGSLRVESGDPVMLNDRVIAFRLAKATERARFAFSLAQ